MAREIYLRYPDEEGPIPDCKTCGACCREAASDGRILVTERDIVRWRREGRGDIVDGLVAGHFGEKAFATASTGACVHLGTEASPHLCSIYLTRAETCHRLEPGSRQCLSYRLDAGITAPAESSC